MAIDRTSKFAYAELHSTAGKKETAQFLRQRAGALPYAIHTVLTDNGIHYDNHQQLENHLHDFIRAYNFARRLKTLNGLTPYEYLCKIWTNRPARFTMNPIYQMPGLNKGSDNDRGFGLGVIVGGTLYHVEK